MRASATILALLLVTGAAAAQEETKPDYSKDSLMRVLRADTKEPERNRNVQFHVGAVTFNALGTRFRFNYLPIMLPLSGTRLGITNEWPDPFSLTQTSIATPRRAWRTQRQVSAELKRIERTERAKIRVDD
jgi:hypothetical protein